jgi:hypothetical protein
MMSIAQQHVAQQFALSCKDKTSDDIYEMFEYASDELRDAVCAEAERLGVVFANESEPTRATMYALGVHYNVQALKDY